MSLRAFGGGPLEGSKLMRLVYMDEAGIANPDHEQHVVVAGVIVHADLQLIAIRQHIDALVERHIPPEHRDGFVFHATELFNGGGKVFDRDKWTLEQRLKIADDLAAIPRTLNLRIAFGWQERATFGKSFDASAFSPHQKTMGCLAVAFLGCATLVDIWMRQNTDNEVCMLVMEDNDSARSILREVQAYNQDPKNLADLDERAKKWLPLKKIVEDPLFQKKKQSSPIQIADFCAYIWKRFLKDQKDERWIRYIKPLGGYLATADPGFEEFD